MVRNREVGVGDGWGALREWKRFMGRLPVWNSDSWYGLWSLLEFAYLFFWLVWSVFLAGMACTYSTDWCVLYLSRG